MSCQLPADCLGEIFEYLEQDKVTLHSCLLVSHFWCEISVRILWRNIWNFKHIEYASSQIISTLIACLSDESKDLLCKNGIFFATSTSKPLLFNYATFPKILSIHKLNQLIHKVLESQQLVTSKSFNYNKYLVLQELLKMFMKQIYSLKGLEYISFLMTNVTFIHFPGAVDCLTDLTVLSCSSDINSEFFYLLSQICCKIQSITIEFEDTISSGLTDLISSQNSLKYLSLELYYGSENWADVIPSLMKHSNSLTKLKIDGGENDGPLSFISTFTNLQELILEFLYYQAFEDLDELQYVIFPQLQVLKFPYGSPKVEILTKFLENNGKSLKELYCSSFSNNSFHLAIAKFCPNLKSLFIMFDYDNNKLETLETLKIILNSCQQLESFNIWYEYGSSDEDELLKVLAKYSPKNLHELILYNDCKLELLLQDFESFFIDWKSRIPLKSLSIIILDTDNYFSDFMSDEKSAKIIEKYKELGVIKKFVTEDYYDYKEYISKGCLNN